MMTHLLDQIIRGNYRIDLAFKAFRTGYSPAMFRTAVEHYSQEAIAVDIQNVYEYTLHDSAPWPFDFDKLYSQVPNHLPFPSMWLECTIDPPLAFAPACLGMLLFEVNMEKMPQGRIISSFNFARIETQVPAVVGGHFYQCEADGELLDKAYVMDVDGSKDGDVYEYRAQSASWLTLNTLIFFACARGVSLRKTESRSKQSKKSLRRSGHPVPDFHVIEVHRYEPKSEKREREASTRDLTRAQIIRGHYQTYKREAPLFGKHVGKWWWKPEVHLPAASAYRVWGPSPEHLARCLINRKIG